jgi:hypothetical protein
MARTVATLPAGSRITDYISLGVIAKFFPADKVHAVLRETGRSSVREPNLPAHVVVYYVIDCVGAVYAVLLSGGLALFAGGRPVAAGPIRPFESGG